MKFVVSIIASEDFSRGYNQAAESGAEANEAAEEVRNCLTCEFEPEWRFNSPRSKDRSGLCQCSFWDGKFYIRHLGDGTFTFDSFSSCTGDDKLELCPAWSPKKPQ